MFTQSTARVFVERLKGVLLPGTISGLLLAAQLNFQRSSSSPLRRFLPGEFAEFLSGARWGSPAVVGGVVAYGVLLAAVYHWLLAPIEGTGSWRSSGLKFGFALWAVQSLYIAWQPLLFLVGVPVPVAAILTTTWLVTSLALGFLLALWHKRWSSPSTKPGGASSRGATSRGWQVIVACVVGGLLAEALAEVVWGAYVSPGNWWGEVIVALGSDSARFEGLVNPTTSLFPSEARTAVRVLLGIPLASAYAVFRPRLSERILLRGIQFGFLIYMLRYVWREGIGDYALLHQPIALMPFFLTTELVLALVQGISMALMVAGVERLLGSRESGGKGLAGSVSTT